MKATDRSKLIPEQKEGKEMDVIERRDLKTIDEANAFFEAACRRLLDINAWGKISGLSDFKLFDQNGNEVDRKGQEGDYIRIDIPGLGPQSGGGFDWVRIEEITQANSQEETFVAIRVRPSVKPGGEETSPAHFLTADATSTFIVRRKSLSVSAEEHGRNELANTHTEGILDKGRNLIVGGAAKLGLSYPQWKLLVKGLVSDQ